MGDRAAVSPILVSEDVGGRLGGIFPVSTGKYMEEEIKDIIPCLIGTNTYRSNNHESNMEFTTKLDEPDGDRHIALGLELFIVHQ